MKRGIDIIIALLEEPTEYERFLALEALAGTQWDNYEEWGQPGAQIWVPIDVFSKIINMTYDGLFGRDVQ